MSGALGEWGRIGVSLCDITAGLNALIGIEQAQRDRARTRLGSTVKVSLFDLAAEPMSVPHLQAPYGGTAPECVGLKHPAITSCGAFSCADGRDIVISIQNERERADFSREVLRDPGRWTMRAVPTTRRAAPIGSGSTARYPQCSVASHAPRSLAVSRQHKLPMAVSTR